MGLEAGDGFISGLVVTNPVGATDPKSQGDDHLRLIKVALKGTFPNLNAAVTASPTELNLTDGLTGFTGTGTVLAKSAGPTFTGTLTGDTIAATLFSGSGASLTSLPAAQLTGSHTAPDGVLSTNVPLLNAANVFTGVNRINAASPEFLWKATGAGSDQKVWDITADAGGNLLFRSINDAENSAVNWGAVTRGTGTAIATIAWAATTLSFTGVVSTPNTSASEVGYKGTPSNAQDGNYGIVLADCGKLIAKAAGGSGETITIPANASIPIPVGSFFHVSNDGGGTLDITITSDTLEDTTGATGTITLADNAYAIVVKIATTKWRLGRLA